MVQHGAPSLTGKLTIGSTVDGRYHITEQLGEGGFATVFKARQAHLDRVVAIKILNVALQLRDDQPFEERFLREAKIAAQLNHPNVVTIYEFGFGGDLRQPYIAMEFLDGHDLHQELAANGPMQPSRAVPLTMGALDALGAGHRLGIVHKDLKPSNLYLVRGLDERELVKVLDYGIARQESQSERRLTATGQFLGTPQYIAPEYVGQQLCTPALDVYQMALILVELLTGRPVVDDESPVGCIMRHSTGELVIPEVVVTGPLGQVLRRALATDHTARYPDGTAFRSALAQVDLAALDRSLYGVDLGPASSFSPPTGAPVSIQTGPGELTAPANAASPQLHSGPIPILQPAYAYPQAPITQGQGDRRGGAIIVFAALAAILLVGVAIAVVQLFVLDDDPSSAQTAVDDQEPRPPPLSTAPPPPKVDLSLPEDLPLPDEEVAEVEPQMPIEATAIAVELDSEPTGAMVFVDGTARGETPLTLELTIQPGRPVPMRLVKRGFEALMFEAEPVDGGKIVKTLEPVTRADKPEPERQRRRPERRRRAATDPEDASKTQRKTLTFVP